MNSKKIFELTQKCEYLRPIFIGVFARDDLPKRKLSRNKSHALIVNLDTKSQPGSHWIGIYAPRKCTYIEYWDSTGRPPRHESILNFLNYQRDFFYFNNMSLQSIYTTTCGQYCLFFLCCRILGLTQREILNFFETDNPEFNDKFVNGVVQNIFKSKLKLVNRHFLQSQLNRLFKLDK